MQNAKKEHIVLFDGECNLCNSFVNFIIRHDKQNKFVFAALQSESAKSLMADRNFVEKEMNTVIYLRKGKVFTRSTAALSILKELSGLYPVLYTLIVIPRFIRDFFYAIISRNRYRWFGKKDKCMVPSEKIKQKFISSFLILMSMFSFHS